MYVQLISIHGLIRGHNVEMGRDSDTGGQIRYVLELARTLSGFDAIERVDLFTRQIKDNRVSSDYSEPIEHLGPKCRLVRLPCGGGKYIRKEKLWPLLDEFVGNMISFTRSEGLTPALVHGHYADAGYVAKEVAAAFGAPFVFTGHSLGRDKLRYLLEEGWTAESANREYAIDHRIQIEEQSLAAADMVVVSTRHERDTQYQRYDNGSEPRFEVIPPGVDLERFFPYYEYDLPGNHVDETFKQARVRMTDELSRFHFQQDKPLILALCRPDKRKNIGALIRAFGEDKELQAVANLAVFAGIRRRIEDLEEAEQQVLTDMLLMMDQYDLYGKMAVPKRHESETDVPELYRIAASQRGVFANPAFVEPFGLTFIEASAVGLPFVGTENGGPQDIAANCGSGLLVDVEDQEALAASLKRLLTDKELWTKCSNNGVNKVREHYTWERHCRRYIECIQDVTDQPAKSTFSIGASGLPGKRMASLDSMLITDIDNTLLGDDEALERLHAIIRTNRDRLGFGVASGRYLEKVIEALEAHDIDDVDVIVSSVGTEIYYGKDHVPDKGWASHLKAKWRPDRIRDLMAQFPFVTLQKDQKTQREFKISYDLDSEVDADEALPQIRDALSKARLAHTLIFSHGTFVDVLPYRASKGKAIRYLSNKWHIPIQRIATAGDSGNDRDMLIGQSAAIVVGNHDEELAHLRESGSRVYFAEGQCAAGIIEGLQHYGFIGAETANQHVDEAQSPAET